MPLSADITPLPLYWYYAFCVIFIRCHFIFFISPLLTFYSFAFLIFWLSTDFWLLFLHWYDIRLSYSLFLDDISAFYWSVSLLSFAILPFIAFYCHIRFAWFSLLLILILLFQMLFIISLIFAIAYFRWYYILPSRLTFLRRFPDITADYFIDYSHYLRHFRWLIIVISFMLMLSPPLFSLFLLIDFFHYYFLLRDFPAFFADADVSLFIFTDADRLRQLFDFSMPIWASILLFTFISLMTLFINIYLFSITISSLSFSNIFWFSSLSFYFILMRSLLIDYIYFLNIIYWWCRFTPLFDHYCCHFFRLSPPFSDIFADFIFWYIFFIFVIDFLIRHYYFAMPDDIFELLPLPLV